MGLKKYEIITVGSDKRVRSLRSWQVGDRYVNIGDVGGIVYDEKTLSQDGACWLFRGNFGFPGARIGGDSIVDVGEANPPAGGSPAVDILGSSVVAGAKLIFESETTVADAVVLTANDFEQGRFDYVKGSNWETWKKADPNALRTKAPIFTGGAAVTLKLSVPGYNVQTFSIDLDGNGLASSALVDTGEGVSTVVPAGQYFVLRLRKAPVAAIVPADATAAKITFTGTYETKLSIIDSRVEINPATSTGVTVIRPGGLYSITPGAKYPDSVIRNSKVAINGHATANRTVRLISEFAGCNVTIDMTTGSSQGVGIHSSVKNLTFTGVVAASWGVAARSIIQANDCDNFAVSPTIFPGLVAAQTANMPFIFQGCNVPGGLFYHHAQIKNTYVNIDFALAQADLGKQVGSIAGRILASSEIEGMYRIFAGTTSYGALVESYDSVKSLTLPDVTGSISATYGTTIYKDAYFNGIFDLAGTNVFGHKVRSHQLAQVLNVAPRAVQGNLALTVGQKPTLVPGSLARVVIDRPIRINTANGITVNNIPAGIQAAFACVDGQGNFVVISTWKEGTATVTNLAQLDLPAAYLVFKKAIDGPITPADIAGVTVTMYNGCKIVNTGKTAVNMKGNIRVEDNATLINADITGTGYFGGNAVMSGVTVEGGAYVKDNAVIVVPAGSAAIRSLKMTENAYAAPASLTLNGHLWLSGNSRFIPAAAASGNGDLFMEDNAVISGSVSVSGSLAMKDNAAVGAGTLTVYGDVTVCGSYNQTVNKTWTGKRTITDSNEPEYDNNVKSKYDF